MPTVTLNGTVTLPLARTRPVVKPSATSGTAHVLGARKGSPAGVYYIASSVPAGAMQAEDATYLLTEDGNYLEVE